MKRVKKLLPVLLAVCLILAPLSATALAAELPFEDVKAGAWYYNDVKNAYENDLIDGKDDVTFAPDSNLTYAEAVKLAACMNQKYTAGAVTLENGAPWYQSYVDYCKDAGILKKDYDWNKPATRAGYIEIFANALPENALTAINTVAEDAIPDVPSSHPQAAAVYKLYRAGVLQGTGEDHLCNPDANIKRSEVAAILTRMMDSSARLTFTMSAARAGTPEADGPWANMDATDLYGNQVDADLFTSHKLTMLNVWATFCGPCIQEMPDLAKLSKDLEAQDVQIVGLVCDVTAYDSTVSANAKQIVSNAGADYVHLVPNERLYDLVLKDTQYVPTTLFIDQNGNIIGDPYVGSRSYDEWNAIIQDILTTLG